MVADNSYHKMFLRQSISEGQGVNTFDMLKIQQLDQYQIYYKTEDYRKSVESNLDPYDLELFRSGDQYNEKMLSYIMDKLKFFSFDECLRQWVRDKYA